MKSSVYRYPVLIILILIVLPQLAVAQNGAGNDMNGKTDGTLLYEKMNVEELPSAIITLSSTRNPFALVVDKEKQELYLYKADSDNYHLVKTYSCTTGENKGIKQRNGDKKTPEGVYFFIDRMDQKKLSRRYGRSTAAQYGTRAFDTDYPNPVDRLFGRQGDGIWLHGTDQPERAVLPNSTRGCVVMRNRDIDEVTPNIDLKETPIIISERVDYSSPDERIGERSRIMNFLNNWKESWENRNFAEYDKFYSDNFRSKHGNKSSWISFKKQVLQSYTEVALELSNFRILKADNYYYIEFDQKFITDLYSDFGIKKLYIHENEGNISIISEQWEAYSEDIQ